MSSKEQTLSDDMEDEKMAGLRKNLLDEFLENQTENVEKLKVYLRVRPFTAEEKQKNHQTCLSIDGKAVTAHAPKDSHTYKNNTYITNKNMQTFMFSRIFDEDTAQAKFYSETCEGLVKNFLTGQNCLVFAYGVTNSGKTYTVQGSQKEPGILPRTLETIFSHVSGKLWDRLDLKPKLYSDVIKLSPRCELEEKRKKEELLGNLDESDNQSTLADSGRESCTLDTQETSDDSDVNEEDLLRSTQMEDSTVYDQLKYSVWVSFAEVYNEQVFDLLENPGSKKRNNLKLGQDKKGNHYIRGLTEVPVSSMEEAQKVLALGQKNLHKAATKLNHSSSRSHCIFNIKLLQFVNLRSPSVAKVSMLSLCDLAGSERTCKTQSTGDRLKEAGNINTSLLTLGQCIKTMRNNQIRKECQLVPYRNSKLTCLFQGFFNGHGEAIMIVNVNKCSKVFDETLQVFKFSAIAKQVVIQKDVLKEPTVNISPVLPVKTLNKLERVSIPWADDAAEADSSGDESFDLTEREAGLLNIIEKCKSTIAWLKEKLDQVNKERLMDEVRTREEITKEMMKHFVLIEKRYDEKMRASQQEAQDNADKWAAKLLTKAHSNKRSHDEMEAEEKMVPLHMLEELQKKNQECEFNIEKLKQQLESTRVQMRRLTVDRSMLHSEKTTLQLQLHAPGVYKNEDEKSVGDNIEQANVLNKLTSMLKETQEKLGKKECAVSVLEEQLEEAGEEFKLQLDKIEKLEKLVEQLQSAPPPECKVCLERCDTNTAPGGLLTKGRQQQQQHQQDQAKNSENPQPLDSIAEFELRERALINGYSAEITKYKLLVRKLRQELGFRNTSHLSPNKNLPTDLDRDLEHHQLKQYLLRQVKKLQGELDKNSQCVSEVLHALEVKKAAEIDLEQRLAKEEKDHEQAKALVSELKEKMKKLRERCRSSSFEAAQTYLTIDSGMSDEGEQLSSSDKPRKNKQLASGDTENLPVSSSSSSINSSGSASEGNKLAAGNGNSGGSKKALEGKADVAEGENVLASIENKQGDAASLFVFNDKNLKDKIIRKNHEILKLQEKLVSYSELDSKLKRNSKENQDLSLKLQQQDKVERGLKRRIKQLEEKVEKIAVYEVEIESQVAIIQHLQAALDEKTKLLTDGEVQRGGEESPVLKRKMEEMQTVMEGLREMVDGSTKELAKNNEKLSDLENKEKMVAALETEVKTLKDNLDKVESKMKEATESFESKIKELQSEKDKVDKEKGSLEEEVQSLKKLVDNKTELETLKDNEAKRKQKTENLESKINELQNEKDKVCKEKGCLEEEVLSLKKLVDNKTEVKALKDNLAKLESKMKETTESFESKIKELQSEKDKISKEKSCLEEEVLRLKKLLSNKTETEMEVLKGNEAKVESTMKEMTESFESKIKELQSEKDKVCKEKGCLEEEVLSLKKLVDNKTEMKVLKDNEAKMKQKTENLESKINELQNEKDKVDKEKGLLEEEVLSLKDLVDSKTKEVSVLKLELKAKDVESEKENQVTVNNLKNMLVMAGSAQKMLEKELVQAKEKLLGKDEETCEILCKIEEHQKNLENLKNQSKVMVGAKALNDVVNKCMKNMFYMAVKTQQALATELARTKDKMSAKEQEICKMSQKVEESEKKIEDLKSESEITQEKNGIETEALNTILNEMSGQIVNMNILKAKLLKEIKSIAEHLKSLKTELAVAHQLKSSMDDSVKGYMADLKSKCQEMVNVAAISSRDRSKSDDIETLFEKKKVELLNLKISTLETELQDNIRMREGFTAEISCLVESLKLKDQRIENLKKKIQFPESTEENDESPNREGAGCENSDVESLSSSSSSSKRQLQQGSTMTDHDVQSPPPKKPARQSAPTKPKRRSLCKKQQQQQQQQQQDAITQVSPEKQDRSRQVFPDMRVHSTQTSPEKPSGLLKVATPEMRVDTTQTSPEKPTGLLKVASPEMRVHSTQTSPGRLSRSFNVAAAPEMRVDSTQTSPEKLKRPSTDEERNEDVTPTRRVSAGDQYQVDSMRQELGSMTSKMELLQKFYDDEKSLSDEIRSELTDVKTKLSEVKASYEAERLVSKRLRYDLSDVRCSLNEVLDCYEQLNFSRSGAVCEATESCGTNDAPEVLESAVKGLLDALTPQQKDVINALRKEGEVWKRKYEETSVELSSERRKVLDKDQQSSERFHALEENDKLRKELISMEKQLKDFQSQHEIQQITMETERMTKQLIEERKRSEDRHIQEDLCRLRTQLQLAKENSEKYAKLKITVEQLREENLRLQELKDRNGGAVNGSNGSGAAGNDDDGGVGSGNGNGNNGIAGNNDGDDNDGNVNCGGDIDLGIVNSPGAGGSGRVVGKFDQRSTCSDAATSPVKDKVDSKDKEGKKDEEEEDAKRKMKASSEPKFEPKPNDDDGVQGCRTCDALRAEKQKLADMLAVSQKKVLAFEEDAMATTPQRSTATESRVGSNRQLRREKILAETAKMEAEFAVKVAQEEIQSLTKQLEKLRETKSEEFSPKEVSSASTTTTTTLRKSFSCQTKDLSILEEDNRQIGKLEEDLEREQRRVSTLQRDVDQKAAIIETLKISLKDQDDAIEKLEDMMDRKNDRIDKLEDELLSQVDAHTAVETSDKCEQCRLSIAASSSDRDEKTTNLQLPYNTTTTTNSSRIAAETGTEDSSLKTVVSNQTDTIQSLSRKKSETEMTCKNLGMEVQHLKMALTVMESERDSLRKRLEMASTKSYQSPTTKSPQTVPPTNQSPSPCKNIRPAASKYPQSPAMKSLMASSASSASPASSSSSQVKELNPNSDGEDKKPVEEVVAGCSPGFRNIEQWRKQKALVVSSIKKAVIARPDGATLTPTAAAAAAGAALHHPLTPSSVGTTAHRRPPTTPQQQQQRATPYSCRASGAGLAAGCRAAAHGSPLATRSMRLNHLRKVIASGVGGGVGGSGGSGRSGGGGGVGGGGGGSGHSGGVGSGVGGAAPMKERKPMSSDLPSESPTIDPPDETPLTAPLSPGGPTNREDYKEIDVTPAVSARSLRKNRKRRPVESSSQKSLLNSSKCSISTRSLNLCHKGKVSDEMPATAHQVSGAEECGGRPSRQAKSLAMKKIQVQQDTLKESPILKRKKGCYDGENERGGGGGGEESGEGSGKSEGSGSGQKTPMERIRSLKNSFRSSSLRKARNLLKPSTNVSSPVWDSPRNQITKPSAAPVAPTRNTNDKKLRSDLTSNESTTSRPKRRLYKEQIVGPMSLMQNVTATTTLKPKEDVFNTIMYQLRNRRKEN